ALGLTVGAVNNQPSPAYYADKREAYAADVTYVDKDSVAFDHLEDQVWWKMDRRVQRGRAYAILDEVDDILKDTALWPLVFMGAAEDEVDTKLKEHAALLERARAIVRRLEVGTHLELCSEDEKTKPVLTEEGWATVETEIRDAIRAGLVQ